MSLRILHCAGYLDALLVHQLWQEIINREVSRQRFSALAQKLAELARKLYPSPFAFPLNFVLDSTLHAAIQGSQTADWVATAFLNAGIPTADLLDQLHEFTESQATFWKQRDHLVYLLETIVAVLNKTNVDNDREMTRLIQERHQKYIQLAGSHSVADQLRIMQERSKTN